MNFDKVIGVSFNRRSEFMGDHLRLKTILDLNIQAESISSSGGDSFSGTQGKIVSLENQAFGGQTFYQNITINGVGFGSGYVTNLTASPDGPDTQKKTYSATVTIISEGNLDEILPSVDKTSSKFIDSISESFTRQQENHRFSVNHTCSIRVNPTAPQQGFSLSDKLLKGILGDQNKLESIFDLDVEETYAPKNYSFDEQSQSYNYQQSYEYLKNDLSDKDCIVIQNNTFNYSNGVINITVATEITGNGKNQTLEQRGQKALQKAADIISQNVDRGLFSYNSLIQGNHKSLQMYPINQTLVFSKTEGKCSVTVNYTNSEELNGSSGTFAYWEYTTEEQKSIDENIYSEQGTIIGGGIINSANETSPSEKKFITADGFFKNNCDINSAMSRSEGSDLKAISESISRSYSEGIVRYNYTFSDNKTLTYSSNDTNKIDRKVVNSSNLQKELFLHSTFIIPEYKELLQIQPNLQPELKTKNSNISINSQAKFSDLINLVDFETFYSDPQLIVDSIVYRFSPKKREFSADLNYYQLRI